MANVVEGREHGMTNEQKARYGHAAMKVGTPDYRHNDDETNAVDTVANVLHAIGAGSRSASVLNTALMHYRRESESDTVSEATEQGRSSLGKPPLSKPPLTGRREECAGAASGPCQSLSEDAFMRASEAFEQRFHEAYRRSRPTVDDDGSAFHEASEEALEVFLAVYLGARPYIVELADEDGETIEVLSTWATDAPDAMERSWPRVRWEREERQDENILPARAYPDGWTEEQLS